MQKEKILPVKYIYIWVKRKKLIKLFYSHNRLKQKEKHELLSDLRKMERAQRYLAHTASIVGKILLRG